MRRYIIFANIALFIIFIFLGMKGYDSLKELSLIKKANISVKDSHRDYTKARKGSHTSFIAGMGHSADYYDVIPEKDLFRPERKEYNEPLSSEGDETQTGKERIPLPAIDLYGIMIDKQKKLALIYDRHEKEPGLRHKVVSLGAEIQGYKLKVIQPEQIVFEKGGFLSTIKLIHKKQARGGIMAAGKKAPKIIEKGETKGKGVQQPVSTKREIPRGRPYKRSGR